MRTHVLGCLACLAVAATAIAGCAGTTPTAAVLGTQVVTITLTDDGCRPEPASVRAGPVTFNIINVSGTRVDEAELKRGDTVMGAKGDLTPGQSGTFSLHLDSGAYAISCPDATADSSPFTVTGTAAASALDPSIRALLDTAVAGYQQFVIDEVDKLVLATNDFTDAIRAGDIVKARTLFAPARYFYEEVEPAAESFGDLDADVDARIDDVDDLAKWTGFHRIEEALWADQSLAGMTPIANKLDADVAKLKTLVATTTYQPGALANGATDLLNEVASSKITGEEDRYSHTDLSDFEANIVGARKAFDLLTPALLRINPPLVTIVSQRFAAVLAALAPYKGSYAGTRFVDYSTVAGNARKVLTQKVDALVQPLSQVAGEVTG